MVAKTSGEKVEFNSNACYIAHMTKLEKIEQDIATLAPAEVHKLAEWLAEYQADLWDRQIEADAKAGKLDKLVEQAKAKLAAGKFREL